MKKWYKIEKINKFKKIVILFISLMCVLKLFSGKFSLSFIRKLTKAFSKMTVEKFQTFSKTSKKLAFFFINPNKILDDLDLIIQLNLKQF